ncbi:MAG: lysophospholipid acyltransferase family protein [Campylobacterota bacterium]|nr:lysophospholipid acyltransferase family protein [Campylobacterota bacterium]
MKSKFATYAEYYGVKSIIGLAMFLPRRWLYLFMRTISLLFYSLSKRRRNITIDNLAQAFPDMDRSSAERLSREVYIELSKTLSDILLMLAGRLDIDDIVTNREEAIEKLKSLKEKHHNGFIFMGAHFSNWELPPLFASKYGFPMVVIGREGDNRLIDQKIIIPFRTEYGNRAVYKKRAGISMIRELKKGGAVGVLIDQKVNKENGFLVPFFGREAFTTNSIAMMKLKLNPLIIPISMPRISEGRYRLEIGDPIYYRADEADDETLKLLKMTEKYNQSLEEIIKKYPTQWFWMHDRWNKRV